MTKTRPADRSANRSTPRTLSSARARTAPHARAAALFAASFVLAAALPAAAQDTGGPGAPAGAPAEPPPPPRILDQERAAVHDRAENGGAAAASGEASEPASRTPASADARPFDAHLAPPQKGRPDDLDEVVVVGRNNPFNLPDLGGAKAAAEAAQGSGRIRVKLLPLDDSYIGASRDEDLFGNREIQRVGYIHLFELRFGGRHKD